MKLGLKLLILASFLASAVAFAALSTKREMPEFLGNRTWYNTKPLQKKDLEGKVTLLSFWNYSNASALRNASYLNRWLDTYAVYGLEVYGLHTPEFPFEENFENFKEIYPNLGFQFPGALDLDRKLWHAYNVLERPAHFFIDSRGRIRGIYYGEKDYDQQEKLIQSLLLETRAGMDVDIGNPPHTVDFTQSTAPEIRFGSRNNSYYGNPEPFKFEKVQKMAEPEFMELHKFYLVGRWEMKEQFIRNAASPSSLIIKFKSNGAHMIATTRYDIPIDVEVLLNGHPISPADAGKDVGVKFGRSFVSLEESRLYQLVDTKDNYSEKTLRLNFEQPGAELYGLSFGRIVPLLVKKETDNEEDNKPVAVIYEYV